MYTPPARLLFVVIFIHARRVIFSERVNVFYLNNRIVRAQFTTRITYLLLIQLNDSSKRENN